MFLYNTHRTLVLYLSFSTKHLYVIFRIGVESSIDYEIRVGVLALYDHDVLFLGFELGKAGSALESHLTQGVPFLSKRSTPQISPSLGHLATSE